MATVAWNEVDFIDLYPQFDGKFTSSQYQLLWEMAQTLVNNADSSPVPYDPDNGVFVRRIILFAVMCHLCMMSQWAANGQSGTVASATEGSVSATFAMPQMGMGSTVGEWYNQTACGRTAWMLLRKYSLGGRYFGINYNHPWG